MRSALALAAALAASPAWSADADFGACLPGLRAAALSQGVSAQVFDAATAALEPDPTVLEAARNQPEFRTPIWDYLAGLDRKSVV